MTLEQQIFDWQGIHSVANARGGQPVDQVTASVKEYLRQRNLIALREFKVRAALLYISRGVVAVEHGSTSRGLDMVRAGASSLLKHLDEAGS